MSLPPETSGLRALAPLYVAEFFILMANAIVFTAIATRAVAAGFDAKIVGFAGSAFYAGLFALYMTGPALVRRVGLKRMIALSGPVAAFGVALLFVQNPFAWLAGRFVMGVGLGLMYVTMENWLSLAVPQRRRGSAFAIYMAVFLGSYAAGQSVLLFLPAGSLQALVAAGIVLAIGLGASAFTAAPAVPASMPAGGGTLPILRHALYAIAAAMTTGIAAGSFYALGPVYALHIGIAPERIAWFLIAVIAGASGAQVLLGIAADRSDRRIVLFAICILATIGAIYLSRANTPSPLLFVVAMAWGSAALTGYATAAAIAYDAPHGRPSSDVARMLLAANGIGGMLGPFAASQLDPIAEGRGLFLLSVLVFPLLAVLVAIEIRRARRAA